MNTSKHYWNEPAETLPDPAYRDAQLASLSRQIEYLWASSPFYRNKLREAGINRGDIRTLDDLTHIPYTEKHELRESQTRHPPLGEHRACAANAVRRIYSTSGTSGRPTYIGLTANDVEVWREAACRTFWACGLRPGDATALVVSPFVIAASYTDALERIGTVIPIGVNATDRLIAAFRVARANALLCTASFPLHLAGSLESRGIDPRDLGLRLILAGGEPGASIPSVRQRIEATFAARLVECSGNGDMCGMMWAECEHRQGMHFLAQGIVHPEIIDPDSGTVLEAAPGVSGELVYTSLKRECIPLLRFRTRDHVVVTHTDCACGRTGFGIRIVGRTDDMLIVRGVNVYPSAVRDVIAALSPRTTGVIEIQIHREPPDGWEPPVHIKVEHGDGLIDAAGLKRDIELLLREKLVFRAEVELVPPDTLPRYEYKARLLRKTYTEVDERGIAGAGARVHPQPLS